MCFEDIVKRITPALRKLARYLNGHFSFFDDGDLFQEALLHLWLRYRNGELEDKNNSYILRSCTFYLKNYLRKTIDKVNLIRLDEPIDESGTPILETISDDKANFEQFLNNKLLIEKIKENGLSKREKEVFNLYLEGLTVREIGGKLGISHVRVVKIKNNIINKCSREFGN